VLFAPFPLAFRMWVSRSAIGSVILTVVLTSPLSLQVGAVVDAHQLALRTPGISPLEAMFRKQIRQIWNFR